MTGSVVSKSPGVHPVIGKTFNWGAREPERGEGGEGRGNVNRDIGRFLAKWRCINTGGTQRRSRIFPEVVGFALTRENKKGRENFSTDSSRDRD